MKTTIGKSIGHDFLTQCYVKFQEEERGLEKERETPGNWMFFKFNVKIRFCSLLTRYLIMNL